MTDMYFMVRNADQKIINVVDWDGVADYRPSYPGCTLYPVVDDVDIGWYRLADGTFDLTTIDVERGRRIEEVAANRKAASQRFVFNGLSMLLDPDTENALSKALQALQRAPAGSHVDWEVSRGIFMTFDLNTVAAIGDAAFMHIQSCFTNARALTLAVNAATSIEELYAIDLTTGWPNGL